LASCSTGCNDCTFTSGATDDEYEEDEEDDEDEDGGRHAEED
jgi:hypothetical protein